MADLLKAYFLAQSIQQRLDEYEAGSRAMAAEQGELRCSTNLKEVFDALADDRRALCLILLDSSVDEREKIGAINEIHNASARLRGTLYDHEETAEERVFLEKQKRIFAQNWASPECFKAFVVLSFYYQPFELRLQTNIHSLPVRQRQIYLQFAMRQPHLMTEEHDAAYINYYKELTSWLMNLMKASDADPAWQPSLLNLIADNLTFGACYYVDLPIGDVVRARAHINEELTKRLPGFDTLKCFPQNATPAAGRSKIRLGIISRNTGFYTDTCALYAMFQGFDRSRYEIYWYSLDAFDLSTISDIDFSRNLCALAHKIVSLRGSGAAIAQQILDDDLDILVLGTAYSFSAKEIDQMLSRKLARVQLTLNALVSGSTGFASFDYFVTSRVSDLDAQENYRAECVEKIKALPDPLIWYEKRPKIGPDERITRAKFGIPDDAVLYCNSASVNRLMAGTLRTWLDILREIPGSYLLLCPFNPAWGGYYIGLTFLARLRSIMRQYPDIDPERVVVARQGTPEESTRFVMLCDVYLGIFPHGGATNAIQALRYGKPVVARDSRWPRGASDPSIVRSLGLDELLGKTNADVTSIAVKLGQNAATRHELAQQIVTCVETAPFFNMANSAELQKSFDGIVEEKRLKSF